MDFSLAICMCMHQRGCFTSPHQVRDERVYELCDDFNEENRYLEYEYDFGASWNQLLCCCVLNFSIDFRK